MNKNYLQSIIGVLIGTVFLYLTLKGKNLSELTDNLQQAKVSWLLISGICLLAILFVRALRWNVMLENIGYKVENRKVFYSVVLAYFVNSFTPRLGEIVRCTTLSKDGNVPVAQSLGSVIMERVYDLLVLFLGLFVIAVLEVDRLGEIFEKITETIQTTVANSMTALLILVVGGLLLLGLLVFLASRFQIFNKIKAFVFDMIESVKSSLLMKKIGLFIAYTVVIWSLLVLMNYCFLLALPQTDNLSLYFAMIVLFVGAVGWALPSPGGIGTTHYIILQLFLIFNLSEDAGITFGILSNGVVFIYTIIFGLIALALRLFQSNSQTS